MLVIKCEETINCTGQSEGLAFHTSGELSVSMCPCSMVRHGVHLDQRLCSADGAEHPSAT